MPGVGVGRKGLFQADGRVVQEHETKEVNSQVRKLKEPVDRVFMAPKFIY